MQSALPLRPLLLAGLCLPLLGCGEAEERIDVSLVNRQMSYDSTYLLEAREVEMHRTPYPGLSQADTAALLARPDSYAEDAPFTARPVELADKEAVRLVLIFNARAPMEARDICALTQAMGRDAPLSKAGFTADVALCDGDRTLAVGSVKAEAPSPETRDAAFAKRALDKLIWSVFGNSAERRAVDQRSLQID
ncbi:hypothetical protein ACQ5SO_08540 [Rhodovulum sp. DZ06]|uniref:hypothetical protein n=1 Tax=Rhodovulum sp. DZ06 TaxID=3425126 RepID=UPI003D329420